MPEPCDTPDFFRTRLAQTIDLRHPLAVLASRLPWAQIEKSLAPCFAQRARDQRDGPMLAEGSASVMLCMRCCARRATTSAGCCVPWCAWGSRPLTCACSG